jgi:hypothetical protein
MRPLARWSWETLREWGWRHTGWGLLVGSLSLYNMGSLLMGLFEEINYFSAWVFNVLQFGMPYVFALRVADRAAAAGVPRAVAYAAVLLVVPLGVWVFGPLLTPLLGESPFWTIRDDFALLTSRLLPFAVATMAYAHWRHERATLERMRAAEVARARQEQLVQASRLLALQARVEPQFLFETLARVRDLAERSAESAEHLLTDLIALLRALQPAAGATASSVEREYALVKAYARASNAPALQAPQLLLASDTPCAQARLAPLVLLPVLRHLTGVASAVSWHVNTTAGGERLRIAITPSVAEESARVALRSVDADLLAQRVAAVHGPQASLRVDGDGAAPGVALDLPLTFVQHESQGADR